MDAEQQKRTYNLVQRVEITVTRYKEEAVFVGLILESPPKKEAYCLVPAAARDLAKKLLHAADKAEARQSEFQQQTER